MTDCGATARKKWGNQQNSRNSLTIKDLRRDAPRFRKSLTIKDL